MGFNFRKSFKIGPARVNVSKSGVGYSIGAKGFRFTKSAKRKKKSKNSLWEGLKGLFLLAAVVALISLVVKYKVIFIVLGILAVLAVVAYLVYVHRQLHQPEEHSSVQPDDSETTPEE